MGNCVGSKGAKKDPKILTEEEIKLLLDNTRLTRAQIVALHSNFLKECPSGKLTKKDFIKLFKEVHPSENKKEKADKFCEYVFKVIDKQNLGYISFQDFVLCFSLTSDGDFKQKCEFAFQLYDLDKDGKISKKEMTQVLTALYDLSGIEDRKKENAPAKKVEDIIKKINATYQPPAPPEPAQPETDGKKAKKEKKPKKPKAPEFITKEQFIDACNQDEQLKQLFVDSIFSKKAESDAVEGRINEIASTLQVELPSVNVLSNGENLETYLNPNEHVEEITTTTTIDVQGSDVPVSVTTSAKIPAEIIEEREEEPANQTLNSEHSEHTQYSEHTEYVNSNYTAEESTSGVKLQESKEQN